LNRLKISGLVDRFEVTDPNEIRELARDLNLDRQFETQTCPFNALLLKRSLMSLSFAGRRFPTMRPRADAERARQQQELWSALSAKADVIASGPPELEPLANWVRSTGPEEEIGILVQQLLGHLFSSQFVATEQSWNAAKVLVAAPRSKNWLKMVWWFVSGKVRRAKRLLGSMVHDDLSAVNAVGIAAHNVVKSFRQMRLPFGTRARPDACTRR
jgi:hypothetical protein